MAQLANHALFGTAVAAATGVPFAMHSVSSDRATQPQNPYGQMQNFDPQTGKPLPAKPVEGSEVSDLAELFNFQITPAWIKERWPRVLATWASPDWQVYRMPVVTGTRPEDLAGSLSYYFDARLELQKIEFTGVTGNARPLVTHLTASHGFIPVATKNPGIQQYQVQTAGFAMGQLTVRMSPVLRENQLHGSLSVELVMRKPATERQMFKEAKTPIDTIRWP